MLNWPICNQRKHTSQFTHKWYNNIGSAKGLRLCVLDLNGLTLYFAYLYWETTKTDSRYRKDCGLCVLDYRKDCGLFSEGFNSYCFYWFYVKHFELQFLYETCYINKVSLLHTLVQCFPTFFQWCPPLRKGSTFVASPHTHTLHILNSPDWGTFLTLPSVRRVVPKRCHVIAIERPYVIKLWCSHSFA